MGDPDRFSALLDHLDRLYAFAQVLTSDAEQAERLVEATYRRAAEHTPSEAASEGAAKARLFQIMLEEARTSTSGAVPPKGLTAYRESLATAFLNRALPAAFVALPLQERIVLVLCEGEGLSCAQAGEVLDVDPAEACHRLETARAVLMNLLRASTRPVERSLLETSLPEHALKNALQRVVQDGFAPLPPTLRPALVAQEPALSVQAPARPPDRNRRPPQPAAERAPGALRKRLQRGGVALAIILVSGLLGYLFSSPPPERGANASVVTLAVERARGADLVLRTDAADRAERFVHNHFGQRLTVPAIAEATLSGVGVEKIADEASVPVFVFYDEITGQSITLYAYSYAFLQQHQDQVELEGDILRQIEDDAHVDIHDLGENKVLVWRHRDDIYVAVTQGNAESLRQRISFPS